MLRQITIVLMLMFLGACSAWSTTTTIQATNDGLAYQWNGVSYVDARDGGGGDSATDYLMIGQGNSTNWNVRRAFLSFTIPTLSNVSSCVLYLNGDSNHSATEFEIYIHGAIAYGGTVENAMFIDFDGRQTGQAHDGTVLNETWASSSWTADWNTITFNAAGRDSVEAAQGGTLYIALISKEDFNNSDPDHVDEYTLFDSSEDNGTEPYLEITYSGFGSEATWNGVAIAKWNGISLPLGHINGNGLEFAGNLIGHWSMDEDDIVSTQMDDLSTNDNKGTIANATYGTNPHGDANGAMVFNGTTTLVNLGNANTFDLTEAISISLWADLYEEPGGSQALVSKREEGVNICYSVKIYQDDLYFTIDDGVNSDNGYWGDISTINWQHLVFTFDRSLIKIYRNGALGPNPTARPEAMPTNTENLYLGRRSADALEVFKGNLCNIRIYDDALTPTEAYYIQFLAK